MGSLTIRKTICHILSFYHCDRIKTVAVLRWNTFVALKTKDSFVDFIVAASNLMAYVLVVIYGTLAILNTCTSPLIAAFIMYDSWNFHQACFIFLYSIILSIVIYKLFAMIKYEWTMMRYIVSDLHDDGCSEK